MGLDSETFIPIPTDFRLHPNNIGLSESAELLYRRILELVGELHYNYDTKGWFHRAHLQCCCHPAGFHRLEYLLAELVAAELLEHRHDQFWLVHWHAYAAEHCNH